MEMRTSSGSLLRVKTEVHAIETASHAHLVSCRGYGVGKGLGLAMVFQIVNNHSGKIELLDKKEKGACFKIVFPSLS